MKDNDHIVLIKMCHVRQAKMCSRGARQFFERHGLDWQQFVNEGVPSDVIEKTGDAMALKVVEVARNGR
jgi:hypothetical protein